ncbi:MAG: energy-coupling factor transporter transmembrane component T, partial [Nitrospirota bacterium]|nr:energy-coupling factor transporter transmembrane component T [Nitrospirota bacterium]
MGIPDWLKTVTRDELQVVNIKKPRERFLDKTLRHVVSFVEDTMFNERTSSIKGFLQGTEPRIKIISIFLFIVLLSFQKTVSGIVVFLSFALMLALLSGVLVILLKRLMPAIFFTMLIALPAALNLIVDGEPLLILHEFEKPHTFYQITIPAHISVTKQGALSALTLFLRVMASVSLVFLLTLTTPPNRFIKAVSSFIPGAFKSIISISYRYIFFLTRKVEEFIMGFRARNISSLAQPQASPLSSASRPRRLERITRHSSLIGQRWTASRIGLLFSMSIRLSAELELAMEARGYNYNFEVQSERLKVS